MSRRSIIRGLGTVIALIAGVALSAGAALTVNLPDPVGPAPGSGSNRLPSVAVPSTGIQILGMDWELALAARSHIAPTVRHATRANAATVDLSERVVSHTTRSSKSRVNLAPGRANGTPSARTPRGSGRPAAAVAAAT
jgi:hypothetical protein